MTPIPNPNPNPNPDPNDLRVWNGLNSCDVLRQDNTKDRAIRCAPVLRQDNRGGLDANSGVRARSLSESTSSSPVSKDTESESSSRDTLAYEELAV